MDYIIINSDNSEKHYDMPKNNNNSCYIDSMLVSILFRHSPTINTIIYGVLTDVPADVHRSQLRYLMNKLGSNIHQPCTDTSSTQVVQKIREVLSHGNFQSDFTSSEQQDASDVLMCILQVIGADKGINTMRTIVRGTYDNTGINPVTFITTNRYEKVGLVYSVSGTDVSDCKSVIDALCLVSDNILSDPYGKSCYTRAITTTKFSPSNAFIIQFNRVDASTMPLDESFRISDIVYTLTGAVLYDGNAQGGHYTSLVSTPSGEFFIYDDMQREQLCSIGNNWDTICKIHHIRNRVVYGIYIALID